MNMNPFRLGIAALAAWFVFASIGPLRSVVLAGDHDATIRLAQNDDHGERHHEGQNRPPPKVRNDEWYQGQRGHWYHEPHGWQWRTAGPGDEWYAGQRGHWYQESHGWQFGTANLVCDNQCRNCRPGGYLPPNGEGMVDPSNSAMCWSCDSDGHHCHWARRPYF